jgi:hypothetical protein
MKIRIPNGRRALTGGALALLALAGVGAASAAASGASTPSHPNVSNNEVTPADTDNIQQGDQTSSDTADAQSEQAASESGPSDGPGGYADTNANADTQQQGEH